MTAKLNRVLKNIKEKSTQLNDWLPSELKEEKIQYKSPELDFEERSWKRKNRRRESENIERKIKDMYKHEEMKKSMGYNRYVPPEIILEESEESENSRLNAFNK